MDKGVLHAGVREDGVGRVPGKAAGGADVGHGEYGRGAAFICGGDELLIINGLQRAVFIGLPAEGTQKREIIQRLVQHGGPDAGVGVAVGLNGLGGPLAAGGGQRQRQSHRQTGGIGQLIVEGQFFHGGAKAPGDAGESVAGAHDVYFQFCHPFTGRYCYILFRAAGKYHGAGTICLPFRAA